MLLLLSHPSCIWLASSSWALVNSCTKSSVCLLLSFLNRFISMLIYSLVYSAIWVTRVRNSSILRRSASYEARWRLLLRDERIWLCNSYFLHTKALYLCTASYAASEWFFAKVVFRTSCYNNVIASFLFISRIVVNVWVISSIITKKLFLLSKFNSSKSISSLFY